MTIAAILDPQLATELGELEDIQPLTVRDWQMELTVSQPEFVLISSLAHSANPQWTGRIADVDPCLDAILTWCRLRGVPSVLWCVNEPLDSMMMRNVAPLVDVVATVDADYIPTYQDLAPRAQVQFLPLAASGEALRGATGSPLGGVERLDIPRPLGQYVLPQSVFDVAATGTVPSLPFTPAARLFFGDLAIVADAEVEHNRQVAALEARDSGIAAAGRKLQEIVEREHTYARRLDTLRGHLPQLTPGTASLDFSPTTPRLYSAGEIFSEAERPEDVEFEVHPDGTASLTAVISKPRYVWGRTMPLARFAGDTGPNNSIPVTFKNSGVRLQLVLEFLTVDGVKISHVSIERNKLTDVDVPVDTYQIRFGIRIPTSGVSQVFGFSAAQLASEDRAIQLPADTLVVATHFPSYERLYQNAFIATRMRGYREAGLPTSFFRLSRQDNGILFREFDGFQVGRGNVEVLRRTLLENNPERVLVHFLNADIVEALADYTGPVFIWVHGYEIQSWRHRATVKSSEADIADLREKYEKAVPMWHKVLGNPPPHWHFVFVSNYLAEQSFEDLGVRPPHHQYTVIPNPIDTEMFPYREKDPELRFQLLSIRPYSSALQANDVAADAVVELSRREGFEQYHFTFIGDGPLWKKITEPLEEFSNVKLQQGFVRQQDIPDYHSKAGVFLVPTRMDTQGVSRSEAMSSGLVPITNPVAAVPEFTDDDCAVLVEPDNPVALADAIEALAADPERFQQLSQGAHKRIMEQVSGPAVIGAELKVIRSTS